MILILPCVTSGGEVAVGLMVMAEGSPPRGGILSVNRGIFSGGSSLARSELRNDPTRVNLWTKLKVTVNIKLSFCLVRAEKSSTFETVHVINELNSIKDHVSLSMWWFFFASCLSWEIKQLWIYCGGGGAAQLVERQTQDPVDSMTRVWTQSGAQEKLVSFSESKMLCWLALTQELAGCTQSADPVAFRLSLPTLVPSCSYCVTAECTAELRMSLCLLFNLDFWWQNRTPTFWNWVVVFYPKFSDTKRHSGTPSTFSYHHQMNTMCEKNKFNLLKTHYVHTFSVWMYKNGSSKHWRYHYVIAVVVVFSLLQMVVDALHLQ